MAQLVFVFFFKLQIVTSVNIYMIHFSTFISRESDSVVSLVGSHSLCLLFSQRKKPTQLQNTWKPKKYLIIHFLSQSNLYFSMAFLSISLFWFLSLEQEITQLGPEGDCGDTWWSSQCGECSSGLLPFFNLHPKSKTDPVLLQTACKLCAQMYVVNIHYHEHFLFLWQLNYCSLINSRLTLLIFYKVMVSF